MVKESARDAPKNAVRSRGNAFDYRMAIPLILVAPDLLRCSQEALAQSHSLAALAAISASPRAQENGLASAVLASLGTRDAPVAPLAAHGAGVDTGNEYAVMADPVLMAADRDSVVLLTRIDDLREEEAAMLLATLNAHFVQDRVRFVAPRPNAWFMLMLDAPPVRLASTDVVQGRGLFAFLPKGDDGRTWRRWQNEIQMLLHEHPANAIREERGATPVTGIWFWGGGTLTAAARVPRILALCQTSRLGDLLTGIARQAGGVSVTVDAEDDVDATLARVQEPWRSSAFIVGAVERIASDEALPQFESRWLRPALRLLVDGSIASLQLISNGNGVAAEWHATRPRWWQRLMPRAKRKSFAAPVLADR